MDLADAFLVPVLLLTQQRMFGCTKPKGTGKSQNERPKLLTERSRYAHKGPSAHRDHRPAALHHDQHDGSRGAPNVGVGAEGAAAAGAGAPNVGVGAEGGAPNVGVGAWDAGAPKTGAAAAGAAAGAANNFGGD